MKKWIDVDNQLKNSNGIPSLLKLINPINLEESKREFEDKTISHESLI